MKDFESIKTADFGQLYRYIEDWYARGAPDYVEKHLVATRIAELNAGSVSEASDWVCAFVGDLNQVVTRFERGSREHAAEMSRLTAKVHRLTIGVLFLTAVICFLTAVMAFPIAAEFF